MMLRSSWLLLVLTVWVTSAQDTKTYRTVCYVQGWTHWRQEPVKFEPEDIDASLCTHVVWDSAELDSTGTNLTVHDNGDEQIYLRLTGLKMDAPDLKVLLEVGGWGSGSAGFPKMVSTPENMKTFAANAILWLRTYNFDGLVLNWDYPVTGPSSVPEDKHRFTVLLQTIMEAFENEATGGKARLLLVSTLAPSPWQSGQSYELPDISKYVDWLELTAFDLHGTWEGGVAHHSPLYSVSFNDQDSIHYMIQRLINMSIPKDKLDLGIPLYGVTFNLTDPLNHDIGAPIQGSGAAGELSHQQGRLAWFEICKLLSNSSFTSGRLSETNAPFVVDGSRWTGYDDVKSIQEKVDYVMENDLGGVSVFTIDMDDFQGLCGGASYPLLHAVQSQFGGVPVGKK